MPPTGAATVVLAGRYTIERVLGEGATAVVYLARDTVGGRAVAIKVLRPELSDSSANARFLKEIRRTAQLHHQHILPVLDSGEHDGRPYFVLPYMEGGTLRHRLKRENQLDIDEAIAITRTVADALDYAHERGLIHRDVKPENILFTDGQACLGDFGIARALESVYGENSTSASVVRGTPAYMSPEQAAGSANLDGRSDVYSLACVFYEMVTGMPAFMGPTPESVIAQRFTHSPREMRVYRPAVAPALEVALGKALAMQPSDRYAAATDFVAALEAAYATSAVRRQAGAAHRARLSWTGGIAAAVLFGIATILVSARATADSALDSTRIALLPLDADTGVRPPWRDDDLLQHGLSRWKDIAVVDQFQVADLVRRRGIISSSADAAAMARAVGAGRYIRGRRSALGRDWRVTLVLYDATSGQPIHQRAETVPNDIDAAMEVYSRLADALLLRNAEGDSSAGTTVRVRSLAAVQAFGQAQEALADWQLARAESALGVAVAHDENYARAQLWLAQVRAWRGRAPDTWGTAADRAVATADQLSEREGSLASALAQMASGNFPAACATYRGMVERFDKDFAAWYGLGQCRMLDKAVVADARSPSGFRFRMSAHAAMIAYQRALELLPSVYRRYQGTSFQNLQALLLVSPHVIWGVGQDGARFFGLPGWSGDSLVLVPYPAAMHVRDGPKPPGYELALQRRGAELRRITAAWSAAFPTSAGAKEAMSAALESAGDATAVETLRRARELAREGTHRRELAAREVMLLVKFGSAGDERLIERARLLSDSLLSGEKASEPVAAMIPVALLRGRCGLAVEMIGRTVPSTTVGAASLVAQSQVAVVRQTLGCPAPAAASVLDSLAARIDREAVSGDHNDATLLDGFLLLRPAIQGTVHHARILERLRGSTGFPQAVAWADLLKGDSTGARAVLTRAESTWLRPPTPDIGLATARLWLGLADTASAERVLSITLDAIRSYDASQFFYDAGTTSAYLAAVVLRADLLAVRGKRRSTDHDRVIGHLWQGSDPATARIAARLARRNE